LRAKRQKRLIEQQAVVKLPTDVIERVFCPVYGLPCWNAKPGYGSSLTFEFGKPHLEIREPRQLEETADEKRKAYHARRHVFLGGQWHLWIHYCNWKAYSNGVFFSDSDTKEGMGLAAEMLDGQKLIKVTANEPDGHTIFEFDLGGVLVTEPEQDYGDDPGDLWLLFEAGGKVLSFREDGMYSYQYGNTLPMEKQWHILETTT